MKIKGIIAGSEKLKRVYIRQTLNGICRNEFVGETYKSVEQIKRDCLARLKKFLVIEF